MKAILFAASLLLVFPVQASDVAEDPLDRAVLEISKDLRCAVCQNQPVSESNADLARDMLDSIANEYKSDKVAHYSRIEPEWPFISHIYFTDNYYTFVRLRVNQLEELNNETKSN